MQHGDVTGDRVNATIILYSYTAKLTGPITQIILSLRRRE